MISHSHLPLSECLRTEGAKKLGQLLLVLPLLVATVAEAGNFRYRDENGSWVFSNVVPAEVVKNGYQVLDKNGRVLRVVPPAPTEEELLKIQTAREREAALKLEQERLAKWDASLTSRYSEVVEIESARDRLLGQIQGKIDITRGNILAAKLQIRG